MSTTPTPTVDASGNEVFLGGDQPGIDNVVSLVAVLCGTEPCMTNTWNNVRFVDRTSSTDSTDLGPLYRPDSDSEGSPSDNKAADMDESQDNEDHDHISTLPIAIAVPLAVLIIAVVVFVFWRKRRKSNQRNRQRGSSYGQLESGGSTPTALVAADSSQRHSVTRHSSFGNQRRSNQTYRNSGLSLRPSDVYESGEMVQVHSPQPTLHSPPPLPPADTRLPPVRSNTRRRRTPPPPPLPPAMSQRQRGNTFSDIPPDDLPPYIDPIEEAMAAGSGTSSTVDATLSPHEHDESSHDDNLQSPPPYHTLSVPSRAHVRN
ncbi:hypothetical protein H4R20_001049 [Coemansia guatemalensis]|uniref:Uncharacterized protein n=1 Tax=Coemansia guatemalensis TaxID=2761395 RepID=A0A9W8HXS2_9FUNG|nr:hypothetical protein H4R20_001049 [Coemansia guatemalensis]